MDEERTALTPEQERVLLASVPVAPLLELLRSEGGVAQRVLAGFRSSAESLKLPPVQERLRRELATNPALGERLWQLWLDTHRGLIATVEALSPAKLKAALPPLVQLWGSARVRLVLLADEREAVRALADSVTAAPPPSPTAAAPHPTPNAAEERRMARLREQVSALRADLATARKEQGSLARQIESQARQVEEQRARVRQAEQETATLRKALERTQRRLERAEKEKAELETLLRESERAQQRLSEEAERRRQEHAAEAQARARQEAMAPPAAEWLCAAREVIRAGQAQSAANLLAHLARAHPDSPLLQEALAEAYAALGALPAAVTAYCRLARQWQRDGEKLPALDAACRALALAPRDTEAHRCLAEVAAALEAARQELHEPIAARLAALARECPAAHQFAREVLRPPRRQTETPLGIESVLQWPHGSGAFTASLRTVVQAIDTNREQLVHQARQALALLRKQSPKTHGAILAVLRAHDDSYRSVLVRHTRPVVVDGSNVAWASGNGSGRPRLRHLLSIRRELRSQGYFPIRIFVDAALVYQIDEADALRRLVESGEVIEGDAGRDADEQILEEARTLGCEVVTNDRMLDHDPGGKVPKLRFEIELDGVVLVRRW